MLKLKSKEKQKFNPVEMFGYYDSADKYLNAHIRGVEPMTAKELTEEQQDLAFENTSNYIEEKFDGTRATLHFYKVDPFIDRFFKGQSIEDRALTYELLQGSGVSGGKQRIYDFFTKNPYDRKVMSEFLKCEFGVSGHSSFETLESFKTARNCDIKGLEVVVKDLKNTIITEKQFKWEYVSDRIKDLIEEGIFYPKEAYTRCFSRRVSKKTDWYCENTDSLPHLRDLCIPELGGTIIDGEMFIPNRPFKDVSSTLNCTWDKAVERQEELGKIVFHTFDILYYKGLCVEKYPLWKRKELLERVVKLIDSPYVELVPYYQCGPKQSIEIPKPDINGILKLSSKYPNLVKCLNSNEKQSLLLTPKAYYEYIVFKGGEGVIVKPKEGKYHHKRGWEYSKVKKYLTRELIVLGFSEPTKEYTGKFPNDSWDYWVDDKNKKIDVSKVENYSAKSLINKGYTPVTRHWYENQVGQLKLGVVVTPEELQNISKNKRGETFTAEEYALKLPYAGFVMQVCECGGFDDELRAEFTKNKKQFIGSVVEVKANELFKDSGKLRHPRFLRVRRDKEPERCIWKDHIL